MTVTTAAVQDSRRRILSLAAVISTSFGVGLLFGAGYPLTAFNFDAWQQPNWMIGLASAVPALGVLVTLPMVPRLVKRTGPVPAMVSGCLITALGFIAMYIVQDPWAWIGIRFLMSAGLAVPWLTGETWINLVSHDEMRSRIIAFYAVSYFLGFSVGPIALQILGLSGPLPFLAAAAAISLTTLPIILARRLAPPFNQKTGHRPIDAMRLAPTAMAGAFLAGIAEITCLSLIGNVGLAAGFEARYALAFVSIMSAGGILLQFPLGWLADRMSKVKLLLAIGLVFMGLSLLLPMALTHLTAASLTIFALGGIILGFYTLSLSIIGERVRSSELGAANVAFLVMYQLGAITGPVLAGVAMTVSPISGFVATALTMMAVCLICIMYLERAAAGREH